MAVKSSHSRAITCAIGQGQRRTIYSKAMQRFESMPITLTTFYPICTLKDGLRIQRGASSRGRASQNLRMPPFIYLFFIEKPVIVGVY
jgi:hypothetical protein